MKKRLSDRNVWGASALTLGLMLGFMAMELIVVARVVGNEVGDDRGVTWMLALAALAMPGHFYTYSHFQVELGLAENTRGVLSGLIISTLIGLLMPIFVIAFGALWLGYHYTARVKWCVQAVVDECFKEQAKDGYTGPTIAPRGPHGLGGPIVH